MRLNKIHTLSYGLVLLILGASCAQAADTVTVDGYTNSNNTVSWTDSQGGSGTVMPDAEGNYKLRIKNTPGLHVITTKTIWVRAGKPDHPGGGIDKVFINSLTLNSPAPDSWISFNPDKGEQLKMDYTSQAADSFDLVVSDHFAPYVPDKPTPAFVALNGCVMPEIIRRTSYLASPGRNTMLWDGKDDKNVPVPAGIYEVEIIRSNMDGLLVLHSGIEAIVQRSSSSPVISGIEKIVKGNSVCINWSTDSNTTGDVFYMQDGVGAGRAASKNASNAHSVYLPNIQSAKTYTFWIIARKPGGESAISEKQAFTVGNWETVEEIGEMPVPNSKTSADICWSVDKVIPGRKWCVHYAEVKSPDKALDWKCVQDKTAGRNHIVRVKGMAVNSEYVYRVIAADDDKHTNPYFSPYSGFTTEHSKPSVKVTSPEEGEVVSGIMTVVVEAKDTAHRYNPNGISKVELIIDGHTHTQVPSHASGTNKYVFKIDVSKMTPGYHYLSAEGTDDYFNTSDDMVNFEVKGSAVTRSAKDKKPKQ